AYAGAPARRPRFVAAAGAWHGRDGSVYLRVPSTNGSTATEIPAQDPGVSRILFLTPETARRMREASAAARGNEVCFLCEVGDAGDVRDPRVVARGNAWAVPAAAGDAEPGMLLVHNHPSGTWIRRRRTWRSRRRCTQGAWAWRSRTTMR